MKGVIVNITTANFDRTLMLVEAWLAEGKKVIIRFPHLAARPQVGTKRDPSFMGLDTEACYLYLNRKWVAAPELEAVVAACFIGEKDITVERTEFPANITDETYGSSPQEIAQWFPLSMSQRFATH